MEEIITICGDNCLMCPRYHANSDEELQKVAELWYRVGWRDKIVSNEEIRCSGCSSHKVCTYNLVECTSTHHISKCNQCSEYPCVKIKEMLQRSEEHRIRCKEKCSKEEYEILKSSFFEKEVNLQK